MTADVTGADRETAMVVMAWDPLSYDEFAKAVNEGGDPDDRESLELVDTIAAALAAARADGEERIRAAVLALAEEFQRMPRLVGSYAADRLRAAVEEASRD